MLRYCRLNLEALVPGLTRCGQILDSVLDPPDGTAELARCGCAGDVLSCRPQLEPERAADIPCQNPHLVHRHVELSGETHAGDMDSLGGGMNGELFGFGVVATDDPPTLHRHVLVAMLAQFGPHHPVGPGKGPLNVAEGGDRRVDQYVATQVFENRWAGGVECLLLGDHGRQFLVVHFHQLAGILGEVPAFGHDQHDGVSDQTDLVGGQDTERGHWQVAGEHAGGTGSPDT